MSWKKYSLPTRFLIVGGQFLNNTRSVLVGGGGTVLFSKDGNEWNLAERSPNPSERLNSVYFVNNDVGWVVGTDGLIFKTVDAGRSWHPQASRVKNTLTDVYFADLKRGYAAGEGGRLLETSDGGQTWLSQVTGVKGILERLAFSGRSGLAVGHGGLILRYTSDE